MPLLATPKTCTGCMACIDSCRFDALQPNHSKNGYLYPEILIDNCTECGKCEKVCPIINPLNNTNYLEDVKPFAAWTLNEELRKKSTSGGVFAQLAHDFIENQKGIVIGATLKDNKVYHIAINSTDEIYKLQGSKYLQSQTVSTYKIVRDNLLNGLPVLFSGTPCQIAGLKSYLGETSNTKNLYTIEVICHGVPSQQLMDYNIAENEYSTFLSFRDKQNGWIKESAAMTYKKPNGKIKRVNQRQGDFFLNSFGRDLSLRESCYECPFSKLPRIADISLADYWGILDWKEQWQKGVSLILTNNQKGSSFFAKNENIEKHITEWQKCLRKNPRIYNGSNLHKYIAHYNQINYILSKFNYKNSYFILSARIPNRNIVWLPYKILVKFFGALVKIQNKRKLKNTLTELYNISKHEI